MIIKRDEVCLLYILRYIKNNINKLPVMEIRKENTKLNKFDEYEIINSLKILESQKLANIKFECSDGEVDTFVIYNITEKGDIYLKEHDFLYKKYVINFIKKFFLPIAITIIAGYVLHLLTKSK